MSSKTAVAKTNKDLNPRTTKLEFLGVPGTTLLVFVIPAVVYALYFGCSEEAGGCTPDIFQLQFVLSRHLKDIEWWKSLWDPTAAMVYSGWLTYCGFTWLVLPGDWIPGFEMRNGERKLYKINALSILLLTLGLVAGTIINFGPQAFTFPHEHWVGLVTSSLIFSYVCSLYLYATSYRGDKLLAEGGNSGNFFYDFWMGRELNPTLGSFDIKEFSELVPGLIGWMLLNISMACEQAVRRGGKITDSMLLVLLFQGWYVFDALYNEPAILSTMDITSDGLGLMLTLGNFCWVPFTFSTQARYLAFNHIELGPVKVLGVCAVQALGYWIFRSSNGEKNDFRNGKNPKNLSFMQTQRGTKLLTSGWWGLSRHPNYMGDLIMALAWCLPTGFNTPITYFYLLYFSILLAHRQRRDDAHCAKKYGDDWAEYMKRVPYRIFPYIY